MITKLKKTFCTIVVRTICFPRPALLRKCRIFLYVGILALSSNVIAAEALTVPAFPGAEGYGKYAVGGRGGKVYEVTTLNSSGPGSLGEAIGASGPRTVVFRVSGTIEGNFNIRNDKITIAGQTAPGEGICIKGSLKVSANDVIIRYIRVRANPTVETDAIGGRYKKNIILDHVSASWSSDEVMSLYHNENVTIQWCMITEACAKGGSGHRFGGIWGNQYGTYHHNLIAHNDSRNPRWASGSKYNDYKNNVLFNWGYQSCYGGEPVQSGRPEYNFTTINMIANYYKPGPATRSGVRDRIAQPAAGGSWYVTENVVVGSPEVTNDNWRGIDGSSYNKMSAPWDAMPINQESAEEAYKMVLKHAGCSFPNRDTIDRRIIEEVRTGTATMGKNGIITKASDVGGWPELKSAPAPADADHDGMPDVWETDRGLNPNDASDGIKDRDGDGYTNVEEYINGLVTSDVSRAAAVPSSKKGIVLEEYVFLKGPTRDCHSSTLLELSNGDLLCTWFGGTRENHPDVNIWLARKPKGGQWQVPVSVADGGGKTCFNPVLVQLKGGDIQIYYCSPNIDTGQVITSSDNGYTWSGPRQLPKGFVGPIVNKPVYMDNGTIIAGSSLQGKPGKRIHVERSTDNGKTWTKIGPISDPTNTKYEIIQPTILVHSQKRLQILARTNEKHENARLAQTWSEDGGLTWSPVTDATLPNNNATIDAVTLDDGRHLLVYNHSTREDPIGGRKGRGILTVAVTKDGINWKAAAVLEYRTGSVQYSYPSVIQTRDGLVHVSYSWHRKRIKHVVIDPKRLETYPIVDGQWPKDKMPWIKSEDPTKFVDYMKVENNINTVNQAMSVGASAESDKNTNTLKLDSIDPRDFLLRYTPADESTVNRYRQYMIKELGELTFGIEGTGVACTINKTVVVPPNVSYNGKGERLTADAKAMLSNLSDQSEDQRPLFLLAPGAGIKNVTITYPGCEGIHIMGDNVLDNIHWGDVGEDAAFVRSYFSGGKITIKNSKAFKASDKMFQFNTSCSVRIENYVGDDMGKLVHHMGSQDVPFHNDLNNVKVTNVVNAVVQSGSRKCHVRYHNLSYKFKGNKDKPERVFRCIPPENVTEY